MRKLLNSLYILSEDRYLTLDGENIVIKSEEEEDKRYPLHMIENIISFSYKGASPALIGKCVENNGTEVYITKKESEEYKNLELASIQSLFSLGNQKKFVFHCYLSFLK